MYGITKEISGCLRLERGGGSKRKEYANEYGIWRR